MIDIALIGTGGMMPLPNRYLTGLAARLNGSMLLIDSGESAQVTLKLLGWGFKNIDIICFTHFHADHIAGLPGLLLTIGNAGRTEPLTVVGPRGVTRIVGALRVIAPELPFPIEFYELPTSGINALQIGEYDLSALPLRHNMPCFGYSLTVHRLPKFDPARAKQLDIPVHLWRRLQCGETVAQSGQTYTPDMVLGPPRRGLKVSYITDTRPTPDIPDFIRDSDLFICEGLYGEDEKLDKARSHMHMIFPEAANLAKSGGVGALWLTHYSPAMPDPENYLKYATQIFPNSYCGKDRMTKTIHFSEE